MRLSAFAYITVLAAFFVNVHTEAASLNPPTIDLSQLSLIGIAGSYNGISLYNDSTQVAQIAPSTASILSYYDSAFHNLASTLSGGSINASCTIGSTLYVGGSFNIGTHSANIVSIDLSSSSVIPLGQGLDGPVFSLYCDAETMSVYAGGNFTAPVTTSPTYGNSLAYYGGGVAVWANHSWNPLPWKGFDGPVYSITKNPHKGTFLFGGAFDSTADGQSNFAPASQVINLYSPSTITSQNTDTNSNASNVVCSQNNSMPWILQGQSPGYWQVQFPTSVHPSLFRLANVHTAQYDTKNFSITALTTQQLLALAYLDPVTGQETICSTSCPLSNDASIASQDFRVVNSTLTDGVRIDIQSWYSNGGGLSSVEIFQSEIFVYAVNEFNSPNCTSSAMSSSATSSSGWTTDTSDSVYTEFLSTSFSASELKSNHASVTFIPYLPEAGYYEVYFYTPGCSDTDTCGQRTLVDVTSYVNGTNTTSTTSTTVNQETESDSADLVYSGYIDASNPAVFQPHFTVTIAKNATQPTKGNTVNVVANSIQLIKLASVSNLTSILEYSPTNSTWGNPTNVIPSGSVVRAMELSSDSSSIYIGGVFSSSDGSYQNIVSYNTATESLTALAQSGPNQQVNDLIVKGSDLFVAGMFTSLVGNTSMNLNHVARYDTSSNTWHALQGGVDGPVYSLNLVKDNSALVVSGNFSSLLDGSGAAANQSAGNAWWQLDNTSWSSDAPYVSGPLVGIYSHGTVDYYVGNLQSAQRYQANGISYVDTNMALQTLPFYPQSNQPYHVQTGVFWNATNSTSSPPTAIVAGSFVLDNGIRNVAFYQNGAWSGINGNLAGQINSMIERDNVLYIGGVFQNSGASSLAIYNLVNKTYSTAPDLYTSDNSPASVNVIRHSPIDNTIVVGGNFSSAGSLTCKGLCSLDMTTLQWNNLGSGIDGNVIDMSFDESGVFVAGQLTLNDAAVPLARYDYGQNLWSTVTDGSGTSLPGPSIALSYDKNTKQSFIAGSTGQGSYIRVWDGQQWSSLSSDIGTGSQISQMVVLPTIGGENRTNLDGDLSSALFVSGVLNLPPYGNVSAALFNGTSWIPLLVASDDSGVAGSMQTVFFESYDFQLTSNKYLSTPVVVLVSVAAALGSVFMIVLSALFVTFVKRRRESRVEPASSPSNYYNKPPPHPDVLAEKFTSMDGTQAGLYGSEKEQVMDNESVTVINEPMQKSYLANVPALPPTAHVPTSKAIANDVFRPENDFRIDSDVHPVSPSASYASPTALYFKYTATPTSAITPTSPSSPQYPYPAYNRTSLQPNSAFSEMLSLPSDQAPRQTLSTMSDASMMLEANQVRLTQLESPATGTARYTGTSSLLDMPHSSSGTPSTLSIEPVAATARLTTVGAPQFGTAEMVQVDPKTLSSVGMGAAAVIASTTHQGREHTPSITVTEPVIHLSTSQRDLNRLDDGSSGLLDISHAEDGLSSDPAIQQWIYSAPPDTARWTTAPSTEGAKGTAVILPVTDDRDDQSIVSEYSTGYVRESVDAGRKLMPSTLFDTQHMRTTSADLSTSLYTQQLANLPPTTENVRLNTPQYAAMPVKMERAPYVEPYEAMSARQDVPVAIHDKMSTDHTAFNMQEKTEEEPLGQDPSQMMFSYAAPPIVPAHQYGRDSRDESLTETTPSFYTSSSEKPVEPHFVDNHEEQLEYNDYHQDRYHVPTTEIHDMDDVEGSVSLRPDSSVYPHQHHHEDDHMLGDVESTRTQTDRPVHPLSMHGVESVAMDADSTLYQQEVAARLTSPHGIDNTLHQQEEVAARPSSPHGADKSNDNTFLRAESPARPISPHSGDGRAASKRMVENYLSTRESIAVPERPQRVFSAAFRALMEKALRNNADQLPSTEDHPNLYYAKFDFSACESDELGFEKDDPVVVVDTNDDIWWIGYRDGEHEIEKGRFPCNYVERATGPPTDITPPLQL